MLIKWVADYKYKAVAEFISAMYTYHADLDTYIPLYGAVDGKAMRRVIDIVTQRQLAYEFDVHMEQLLIEND